MRLSIIAGTVLMLASSAAMANGLEFQLGNKTAQLTFMTDSGLIGYSGGDLDFSLFTNTKNDFMGSAGLLVQGIPAGTSPLTFGLGIKGYGFRVNDPRDSVGALALGGLVKYTIPSTTPMAVVFEGHYAPSITTVGDGKSLTDLSVDYQIEVTPGGTAFAGYRLLQTNLKNYGDYSLDDNVHIGVRFTF